MLPKEFFHNHNDANGFGLGYGSPYEMKEFDILAGSNGYGDGYWFGYGHQNGNGNGDGNHFGYSDQDGGGFGSGFKYFNFKE